MISQQAVNPLMEWTSISNRIITARFYTRYMRVSKIQAYAPHNEKEEEEKEQFYQRLQDTLDGCNKNDIIIKSANGRVKNQLDHLLTKGQWRYSVLDSKAAQMPTVTLLGEDPAQAATQYIQEQV